MYECVEGIMFMLNDMIDAYDMSDADDMCITYVCVVHECFAMYEENHCLDT